MLTYANQYVNFSVIFTDLSSWYILWFSHSVLCNNYTTFEHFCVTVYFNICNLLPNKFPVPHQWTNFPFPVSLVGWSLTALSAQQGTD